MTQQQDYSPYSELHKLGGLLQKPQRKFKQPRPQKTILLRCRNCQYTFVATTSGEYMKCFNCQRQIDVGDDVYDTERTLKAVYNKERRGESGS